MTRESDTIGFENLAMDDIIGRLTDKKRGCVFGAEQIIAIRSATTRRGGFENGIGPIEALLRFAGGEDAILIWSELRSCLVSRKYFSFERTFPDLTPLPCGGASRFYLFSCIPLLQQY